MALTMLEPGSPDTLECMSTVPRVVLSTEKLHFVPRVSSIVKVCEPAEIFFLKLLETTSWPVLRSQT